MRRPLSILTVLFFLFLLRLASCGPAPTPTAVAVLPTDTPVPTDTPTATATPTLTPTPTPPIRSYQLSLLSSSLPRGEYAAVSLLGETPAAPLTVVGVGRIANYVPVAEIPPYATIMMQLQPE